MWVHGLRWLGLLEAIPILLPQDHLHQGALPAHLAHRQPTSRPSSMGRGRHYRPVHCAPLPCSCHQPHQMA